MFPRSTKRPDRLTFPIFATSSPILIVLARMSRDESALIAPFKFTRPPIEDISGDVSEPAPVEKILKLLFGLDPAPETDASRLILEV